MPPRCYTQMTVTNGYARCTSSASVVFMCILESIKTDQSKRRIWTPCRQPSIVCDVDVAPSFAFCRFTEKSLSIESQSMSNSLDRNAL